MGVTPAILSRITKSVIFAIKVSQSSLTYLWTPSYTKQQAHNECNHSDNAQYINTLDLGHDGFSAWLASFFEQKRVDCDCSTCKNDIQPEILYNEHQYVG